MSFHRFSCRARSSGRSSIGSAASMPTSALSPHSGWRVCCSPCRHRRRTSTTTSPRPCWARLDTLHAAGIYAAVYRILDFTFVPMRAALAAAYPRFFKSGANGLGSALRVSKKIALPGIAYAGIVAGVLLFGSTAIPVVLGAEYSQSVGAVQMLAALPLLRWTHYLAADSLTGAGYQGARTVCQ
jgi:hypothetical protein